MLTRATVELVRLIDRLGITEGLFRPWAEDTFFIPKPNCPEAVQNAFVHALRRNRIVVASYGVVQFECKEFEDIFGTEPDYAAYMASAPLPVFRLRGENAIFRARWIKRYFRALHGRAQAQHGNHVHTSDSPSELRKLANKLRVSGFKFFADCSVPLEALGSASQVFWRNYELSWIGVYASASDVRESVEQALRLREDIPSMAAFVGIGVPHLSAIVYPHPFDYETLVSRRHTTDEVIDRFAQNDALNIAVPRLGAVGNDADQHAVLCALGITERTPFANAALYSSPSVDAKSERILERIGHVSSLSLAAGSYGANDVHPSPTSSDKFQALAKHWKIF